MAKKESVVFAGGDEIEEENLVADDGYPLEKADISPPPPPDPEDEPKPAPEPEAKPEEKPEAAPEPEPENEGTVPSWRLAQEASRRRQAEQHAAEMEAYLRNIQSRTMAEQIVQGKQGAEPQPEPAFEPFDFNLDLGDNPKQMFDKALDGDLDTANRLFGEMVTTAARKAAEAAVRRAPAAKAAAEKPEVDLDSEINNRVMALRLREQEEQVISGLEQAFPVFNPQSKQFNASMVEEVLTIQNAFIERKFTPAEAMERAALMVLKTYDMAPTKAAPAATKNNSAAVARNLDANNRQPPDVPTGAGNGTQAVDPTKLTEEEFAALPDAVIARLRGDFV